MSTVSDTQESSVQPNVLPKDTLKILVATDIHLGYNEKDPIRGDDSFNTFEEILSIGVENQVDFILLGGDLFHDATPSPNSLQKCVTLLHRYTLGDKPIEFEFLSDQSSNFADSLNQCVNYQDPNLNIAYPIFSIHGNHDDPSGFGRLSSLDLLSSTGLINYFGKWTDLTQINIKPLLLRKGDTQLAIYGLSHIHDNRLCRLFSNSKVTLERPSDDTGTWFNLMVLHQNRANRGEKNYLPETILPDFIDLVIWGHEHDCRIVPEVSANGIFISQPGSSVATSLSQGESIEKKVSILKIAHDEFIMENIKLQTVRPFVFDIINLTEELLNDSNDDVYDGDVVQKIQQICTDKIKEMLQKSKEKCTAHVKQPTQPLIRLRLDYLDEDHMFNAIRFGQRYNGIVANPMDMILFKKLIKRKLKTDDATQFDAKTFHDIYDKNDDNDAANAANVIDLVEKYFQTVDDKQQLNVVPIKSMSELCRNLVENDDEDAAENILKFHKLKMCEYLNAKLPAEDDCLIELFGFNLNSDKMHTDMLTMLDSRGKKSGGSATTSAKSTAAVYELSDDDDNATTSTKSSTKKAAAEPKTRGGRPARGRGSRGGRIASNTAAANKSNPQQQLNITSVKQPAAKQPSIIDAMSTSRSSQRSSAGRKPTKFTQYDSDSD